MPENLLNSAIPLITYVWAFLVLCFTVLKFFLKEKSTKALDNGLIFANACIAIANICNTREIEPYLSIGILVVAGVVISSLLKRRIRELYKLFISQKRANSKDILNSVVLSFSILLFLINIPLIISYEKINLDGVEITAMLHEEVTSNTNDDKIPHHAAMLALWEEEIADAFEDKYGVKVEIRGVAPTIDGRYKQFKDILDNESKSGKVDVFAIDVIWPDLLADYAEDLNGLVGGVSEDIFFEEIIDNNTVDDKLVALPWYVDAGLLFYRKDLLGDKDPPETWDELEKMARDIQTQERQQGNQDFWGFVWEGEDGEGLTCVALEWQASHGGGQILEEFGSEDFDIDATTTAFQRAKGWIGDITPDNITDYSGSDVLDIWKDRNALFMRHWPYAYNVSVGSDNPPFKEEDIGVTLLPKDGNTKNSKHISTLGGWQLMVNKNSSGRQKQAAKKFVQFLSTNLKGNTPKLENTSPLISLIDKTRKIPALKEAYSSAKAKSKLPYISNISTKISDLKLSKMFNKDIEMQIVKRPSKAVDEKYLGMSKNYSYGVHELLASKESFKNKAAIKARVKDIKNKIRGL